MAASPCLARLMQLSFGLCGSYIYISACINECISYTCSHHLSSIRYFHLKGKDR